MMTDSKTRALGPGLGATLSDYRHVAEIGSGEVSDVSLALLPTLDGSRRLLLLKELRADFSQQDEFRAMFENEALLGRRFRHPNVVEACDAHFERERCVLVFEFLDGQTLSSIRKRANQNQVPFAIQLRVLADALAGLHYVHELKDRGKPLGIVHRDVSPSNLFVTYDGQVKLIDFAVARATLDDADARTKGLVKGKLGYRSPEAVRGERIDRRSDIFSVGVMLWEAATGKRLWHGQDQLTMLRRLSAGDLPIEAPQAEGTSAEMLKIATRALAVDPLHRFATAEDMRREIEGVLARLGKTTRVGTLAGYLQTFFAAERQKSRAMVDDAMTRPLPPPPVRSSPPPLHPAVQRSNPGFVSNALRTSYPALDLSEPVTRVSTPPGMSDTFRTSSTTYDVTEHASLVPNFRPRFPRVLGVAGLAAAVAVGIAYGAQSSRDMTAHAHAASANAGSETMVAPVEPARTQNIAPAVILQDRAAAAAASPTAAPTNTAPLAAADAAGASDTISAVFVVHPFHAKLYLDGVPLEGTPAGIRRRPDDRPLLFRAVAPGYATTVRVVDLNRDVAKEIELVPEGAPAGRSPMTAPSAETHPDGSKGRPSKRGAARDDPWGI
ncbi:MAG: serine/threonine-protein kinase [Polyangiaceae bacterium]